MISHNQPGLKNLLTRERSYRGVVLHDVKIIVSILDEGVVIQARYIQVLRGLPLTSTKVVSCMVI